MSAFILEYITNDFLWSLDSLAGSIKTARYWRTWSGPRRFKSSVSLTLSKSSLWCDLLKNTDLFCLLVLEVGSILFCVRLSDRNWNWEKRTSCSSMRVRHRGSRIALSLSLDTIHFVVDFQTKFYQAAWVDELGNLGEK